MNRPKYGSLAALDESDVRNEKPEILCRCDNCGRTFEQSEGCDCWPETEAELA